MGNSNSHMFSTCATCQQSSVHRAEPLQRPTIVSSQKNIKFYNAEQMMNKSIFCGSRPTQQTRTRKHVLHLRTSTFLQNTHHHSDRAYHARSSLPKKKTCSTKQIFSNRKQFLRLRLKAQDASDATRATQLHLNNSLHNIPHDKHMHH